MWLFTNLGFFSIVQKADTSHLTVRARVKADLEALRAEVLPTLTESVAHQGSDYPWRATISHDAFAAGLGTLASRITYPNFKNEIATKQGPARAHRYGEVWHALYGMTE